jgi:ribosome-associated translation inhibitor RaiA
MIQTVKEKSQAISVVSEKIIEEKKEIRLNEEYIYNEINAVIDTLQQQLQRTKENLMEKVAKQVKQKYQMLPSPMVLCRIPQA